MPNLVPLHFIGEAITVEFDEPPLWEKKPGCPNRFIWREETHIVAERVSEWFDYTRRGRAARNMQPQHAAVAANRGSWGVGRYYFQVRTTANRFFELYYDRAPKGADERKGAWFLVSELKEQDSNSKIQDSN
jgi:hypothetical protein